LVSEDVPTRQSMTFNDHEGMIETVIGYIDQPQDGQLRVIDVSYVEYLGNKSVNFIAMFDEEALKAFNSFRIKPSASGSAAGILQLFREQSRDYKSLKRHLMRSF
ncbi:hypothetical protein FOZ62_019167, partial [Perkinsus olseni]